MSDTTLTLSLRSGRVLGQIDLKKPVAEATVADLQRAIHRQYSKWYPDRQRLTYENKPLDRSAPLSKYNISANDTITFKDLGPQIGWTTVFLLEYLGPLVIHLLFYFFPSVFYPGTKPEPRSQLQTLLVILNVLHYFKREIETLFVHRFSNSTMPLRNLPKNSFHYWVLGGLLHYPVYRPGFTGGALPRVHSVIAIYLTVAIWAYAELSNFKTHVTLRNLRPPGTRVRKIPRGYGFDWVSCPNYFFEVVGWMCVSALTGSVPVYFFTIVGFVQMYLWAVKKHIRYRRDFGNSYPKERKVMVPFVL
ncbi:3-oxo-5-alpha-steroid 4-dehydrogenase-domain-containing protein [Gaertneriomyces semiglobifer]|nr:3-oxo-5-alpha-steroid 4-dehydrogenase-domain-containing protein [Gaertneriomyces semiglobifer]